MSRGIDPYNKKALDYDSRGLWLNGVAVESGERRERTMDDLAAISRGRRVIGEITPYPV